MPARTGGDMPDPIDTETEYFGKALVPNTVGDRGPDERELEPHEKLRLGYLTGQDEDVYADRQPAFMGGVDDRFPLNPEIEYDIDPKNTFVDDNRGQM